MTYRIEIMAETLSELAGKALALAAQFQVTAADPVMPEVKAATRKAKPVKVEEPEVAEQASVDPTPSEAASSGPTEASPTAPSGPEPETPTTGNVEIDVIRDVQPLVLAAIDKTSKEQISALIQTYGAERVTKLDPSKLPALIADLKEILG